ncbi:MAG: transposase [Planctomycetota bacterium]|nr:transposase [Planctomycetota bacterium]MDA1180598.1 transposase [Planctomycetota bacterium]
MRGRRRNKFFLPIRVLSRVFRGKFVQELRNARAQGELQFHGNLAELADPTRFESFVSSLIRHNWVVYAKRPFGGPRQVLKYLARYTHRVAISDSRLLNLSNDEVTFKYKDYADNNGKKAMTLSTTEFIRRFLMHTLPNGFVRIRYYGFLANRFRRTQIDHVRGLLGCGLGESPHNAQIAADPSVDHECPRDVCPVCKTDQWRVVERIDGIHPSTPARPHFAHLLRQPDDGSVEVIHFGIPSGLLDTS